MTYCYYYTTSHFLFFLDKNTLNMAIEKKNNLSSIQNIFQTFLIYYAAVAKKKLQGPIVINLWLVFIICFF